MLIAGKEFGFVAIVGALGLVGMMIKNGVVLVDEVDIQIRSGKDPFLALVDASYLPFTSGIPGGDDDYFGNDPFGERRYVRGFGGYDYGRTVYRNNHYSGDFTDIIFFIFPYPSC